MTRAPQDPGAAQGGTTGLPFGGVHHYVSGVFTWGPAPSAAGKPPAPKPPTPTPTPTPPAGTPVPLAPAQQSAYDMLDGILSAAGLDSLAGQVKSLILNGSLDNNSNGDTLQMYLGGTAEWKQRFAGNEQLKAKGLNALTVGEYLSQEKAYAQVLSTAGLPSGFYDTKQDFGNFIGNNVSASELQQRVTDYTDLAKREDQGTLSQLASMGMSHGDLAAYMMDPTKAAPLIQQKFNEALVGGAARNAGFNNVSEVDIARLASQGVSEQQAQQGFSQIGQTLPTTSRLADIYGQKYGFGQAEAEAFSGDAAATSTRNLLASQERAAFSGSGGITSGSIRRDDVGEY